MTSLGRNTKYLFSLPLILFANLFAQEAPALEVQLRTPLMVDTDPGKIVSASFLVSNHTQNREEFLARVELPEGWQTIPFKQVKFSLDGGEQTVQLLTIRVPNNYPSGQYKISYAVQGLNTPELIRSQEFFIYVLPNKKIDAYLKPLPRYIEAGEPYETTLTISNNGNVESPIEIEATSSLKNLVFVEPKSFLLKPQEKQVVTIHVETKHEPMSRPYYDVLSVRIEPEQITKSDRVEIFPKLSKNFDPYIYIPSKLTYGYAMKDQKKQVYGQLSGRGFIDENRERNLEYYALLTPLNQFNVYRNLGGLPERAYLHYWDKRIDVYVGEGNYTLTPLTMRTRFGQGASISVKPNNVKVGALYVDDSSSVPRKNGAGYMTYTPNKKVSVSTTYLYTDLEKNSPSILEKRETTSTGSIRATLTPKKQMMFDAEYAATLDVKGPLSKRSSFYVRANGEPIPGVALAVEKILAKPNFVGYYNNSDQVSASMSAPLYKFLRGFYSINSIKTNLNESPDRSLTRYKSQTGGLNCTFPGGVYGSVSYNFVDFSNRDFSQTAQFGRLNFGKSFPRWAIQGIVELGGQKSENWLNHNRSWQNYQLYYYIQPVKDLRYALFGYFGNILLNEEANQRYTLGTSLSWRYSKQLKLRLLYEQTLYPDALSRNHCNASMEYTFKNGHYFQFQSNYYKKQTEKHIFEFLLSYTVPWKLPINKKKSVSSLRGKIKQDTSKPTRLVVTCAKERILTDKEGNFAFNHLNPGPNSVFVEESNEFVFCDKLPIEVELEGGKRKTIEIQTAAPGSVSGIIEMYSFDRNTWEGGTNERECILQGGLENTLVQAISEDRKLIYQEVTNQQGTFSFERLKPGKWIIRILNPDIPTHHYLDQKEFEVTVSSGEVSSVQAKIMPSIRQTFFIDSGEIE